MKTKSTPAAHVQLPSSRPDWNPELFLGQNYINHLGVYRTSLLREIGGFREGFEGSQDYDLALRCIERLSPPRSGTFRAFFTIGARWLPEASPRCPMRSRTQRKPRGARLPDHLNRRGIRRAGGTLSRECRIASRGLRAACSAPARFPSSFQRAIGSICSNDASRAFGKRPIILRLNSSSSITVPPSRRR